MIGLFFTSNLIQQQSLHYDTHLMLQSNFYPIFSRFQFYDFRSDVGLVVGNSLTKSVELIKNDGTKTRLPELPINQTSSSWFDTASPLHDPCMVYVNKTTVFLAGGYSKKPLPYSREKICDGK